MWKKDLLVHEDLAVLEVMLGVHPEGTRISDLGGEFYKIVWEERENPIIARNYWSDYGGYFRIAAREMLDFLVIDGKLDERSLSIPHTHIINSRLHKSVIHSVNGLIKHKNYSKENIEYVKSLGRRFKTGFSGVTI